jgi:Tannase and feruloyl esterase
VARYYGRASNRPYFIGGSTGGRQAVIEAQRFPFDFDGIIAGVPSLSVTGIHMNLLWGNRAFMDSRGEPIFRQADLEVLHNAVVAACDMNHGVKDGLIGDPRACTFDPAELRCAPGKTARCLTPKKIEAAKKLYSGPVTSKGEPIYMPGALRGSEKTWLDLFAGGSAPHPGGIYDFVREEFRYSAFQPNPGPTWKPEDFDFDRDYKRFGMTESLSAAVNPDLRRFKAAGGKLLAYAGWSDAAGMPLHTVDYYEAAENTLGGRTATLSFFRLFVIPGMGHWLGDGAFAVDWLSYLEAWVEKDQAPDKLMSFHMEIEDLRLDDPELIRRTELPLDPAFIEFSRPLYPYPREARYVGHGDPKDATNYEAAEHQTRNTHERQWNCHRCGPRHRLSR